MHLIICRDKIWFWLMVLAVVVRLLMLAGIWAEPGRALVPDSADYLRLAENLTAHQTFGSPGNPESFRVPGYPLFLAGLRRIVNSLPSIIFIQVMLGVANCLLVWNLARRLTGDKGGYWALGVQALSLVSVVYACRILSESLFVFVFLLFLNLFLLAPLRIRFFKDWLHIAGAGFALGVAAYVRTVALPVAAVCLVYWLMRRRFKPAILFFTMWVITVSPWYARNIVVTGHPHFSTVSAINMYRYNACMLMAHENDRSFAEQQMLLDNELRRFDSQADAGRYAARRSRQVISRRPLLYAWLHIKTVPVNLLPAGGELLQTFGVDLGRSDTLRVIRGEGLAAGLQHYFQDNWRWLIVLIPVILLLAAVYLVAAAGCLRGLSVDGFKLQVLFILVVAVYFLIVPGGAAHPRFRVPVMPLLALLAAHWAVARTSDKASSAT